MLVPLDVQRSSEINFNRKGGTAFSPGHFVGLGRLGAAKNEKCYFFASSMAGAISTSQTDPSSLAGPQGKEVTLRIGELQALRCQVQICGYGSKSYQGAAGFSPCCH